MEEDIGCVEELAGWPLWPSPPSLYSPRPAAVAAVHSRSRVQVRRARRAVRSPFGLYAAEPTDSWEHERNVRRRHVDAIRRSWCGTTPTRRPGARHRGVDRDQGQQDLHRQAEAGYKFQDGTEVKAKNFVDAWNWTAYGPNGQPEQLLFRADRRLRRRAVGTDAQGDADCKGKPARPRDDRAKGGRRPHLHDQDQRQVSNLPVRLGYSAFAPLPDSFFADPKASVRSRSAPARSSWTARPTPSRCSRSSPTTRAATSRTWTR